MKSLYYVIIDQFPNQIFQDFLYTDILKIESTFTKS
jgi:hypothetical protein